MTSPDISDLFHQNVRAFRAWAGAIVLLVLIQGLQAQGNISFEAAINVKEVIVGVPFEVTFTLKNAEGSRFTAPSFPGFRAGGLSEMRGMSIVNGRSSVSQTWSIDLTPTRPGTFPIGAATVSAAGRVISTKPLTINVVSAASSSKGNVNLPPGSDDKVFVAADFDRKEAYPGQQVTWRIRLYTQLSVEGYDIIALPDFEGFFSKEKVRYDKRVEYLNLRKKKYAVRTLYEEALFPQEAGEFTIGPARVSVGIEQPGAQGFLFGPKPVSLQTQPVTLLVKALPQPPPAEFTGGVGAYTWEVKTDSTILTTDDALTLVIEVKGNGDARRFAAPKITVPSSFEIFEPRILEEETYEGELEILHRKRFEYIVLPKDTGNQVITPVLAYFDTDSNRYVQLSTEPIRIQVSAGKNYQSPTIVGPIETPPPPDASLAERLSAGLKSPILWSFLGLSILFAGIFFLLKKRKNTPAAPPPPPVVQKTAPPVLPKTEIADTDAAKKRFYATEQYLKESNPHRFYDELFKSLQGWLHARFGLQTAQMNDIDISALLRQRGAPSIRIQALLSVWHTCEQAIYGGQAQVEQMESTWQMARQVLEALEREIS